MVGKIVRAVRAKYPAAYVRKLSDRHARGLPDLLIVLPILNVVDCNDQVIWPGTLFVEVKTSDGRLSPIQKAEHEKIRAAGADVLVATEASKVLFWLEQMGAV